MRLKLPERQHTHAEFVSFIAESLFDRAPNRQERDQLQDTIYGAHMHYVPKGYGHRVIGLTDMLTPEHKWIIDTIRDSQNTWKLTRKELPFDFLDPGRGDMFQDLGEAIGAAERKRLSRSGEFKG